MENIYNKCYETLLSVFNTAKNKDKFDSDIIIDMIEFLTNNDTYYEGILEEFYDYKNIDKLVYKKIMMLIIASNSYYLSVYELERDINIESNSILLKKLKEIDCKKIILMFNNWQENSFVLELIQVFLEFTERNFVVKKNCIEEIIKQKKINDILKINPFEIVNFLNIINQENLIITEKLIQKFIDIYESAISEVQFLKCGNLLFKDFDFILFVFQKKVIEQFNYDENSIKNFYSYVFSNIYESLVIYSAIDLNIVKRYNLLFEIFKKNFSYDYIYNEYIHNLNFSKQIIDSFLTFNDGLFYNDLLQRREEFKKIGNIKLLKKLNPYYDEEESEFIKRKRYPN